MRHASRAMQVPCLCQSSTSAGNFPVPLLGRRTPIAGLGACLGKLARRDAEQHDADVGGGRRVWPPLQPLIVRRVCLHAAGPLNVRRRRAGTVWSTSHRCLGVPAKWRLIACPGCVPVHQACHDAAGTSQHWPGTAEGHARHTAWLGQQRPGMLAQQQQRSRSKPATQFAWYDSTSCARTRTGTAQRSARPRTAHTSDGDCGHTPPPKEAHGELR
jgi:hypothetical protein